MSVWGAPDQSPKIGHVPQWMLESESCRAERFNRTLADGFLCALRVQI